MTDATPLPDVLTLPGVGPFQEAQVYLPVKFDQGGLLLLEGPNGSGKTTLLQTLAITLFANPLGLLALPLTIWERRLDSKPRLPQLRWSNVTCAVHLADYLNTSTRQHWSAHIIGDATQAQRIDRWADKADGPYPFAAFAYGRGVKTPLLATQGPGPISADPRAGAMSFSTGAWVTPLGQLLINLHFDKIRTLATDNSPAGVQQAAAYDAQLEALTALLSEVMELPVTIDFPAGTYQPRIKFGGETIDPELLGEGLRGLFAWITDLWFRLSQLDWASDVPPFQRSFLLLLDEMDESLHPRAQAKLYGRLRKLMPNACIIASTHSPFAVAGAGEGWVLRLRPDAQRKIRGEVHPEKITPGLSLDWVTTEIFSAPIGIIDHETRAQLDQHDQMVRNIGKDKEINWADFFRLRDYLMNLNGEVAAIVAFREAPAHQKIARRLASSHS